MHAETLEEDIRDALETVADLHAKIGRDVLRWIAATVDELGHGDVASIAYSPMWETPEVCFRGAWDEHGAAVAEEVHARLDAALSDHDAFNQLRNTPHAVIAAYSAASSVGQPARLDLARIRRELGD